MACGENLLHAIFFAYTGETAACRRFKAATGRLPGGYLQALRIAIAKELLEQGRVPIQAVCAQTGYTDAAFFRALFRRHTGMTPAEYRANFAGMNFSREEIAT